MNKSEYKLIELLLKLNVITPEQFLEAQLNAQVSMDEDWYAT